MPFIGDGGADIEVVADHLLYESMQTRTSKVEGAIPEQDLKEYLNIVCSYKVQLTPQAKKLLRNYFVASRRERPDCLPLNALKTLTALAEAHARLCLRTIVTYDDVVLVVFLYEESIAALYGTSLMSPPPSMLGADSSNFTITEQITLTLKNFSMWLDQYVKSLLSEGSVNCSLPEE
ncbi:uncharacterized protein LOC128990520 [Macrosteles quadrilineatus]|uniref:uncharacterized protein LOC128990520 n=1 Tax=Macrosteles quadrilineatus TaxID=74068 RepID=UPI0023E08F32|nr:uncharacterized protein LOC128990520 [Macrosteles quadrilineatus]XP_054268890.1 uncharacterized protein LOC128990520 [Macrosteles quadrilineatus]